MPTAISYIRFSSIRQGSGSTVERQKRLRDDWLVANPSFTLATSVLDLGKSAFKGDHLEHGLGRIRQGIKSGQIESGSYLLIEAFDRLGRLSLMDMWRLLAEILAAGVTIVTLDDNVEYSEKSLNDVAHSAYVLIGKFQQAHQYSAALSRRIKAANQSKRERAKNLVSIKRNNCFWLDSSGKLIPDKADAVRAVIKLYLKGHGPRGILNQLHKIYPCLSKTHPRTLDRWFKNPSLAGHWKTSSGEVIKNVFDALIPNDEYYLIQAQLQSRKMKMGTPQTYPISGLVVCKHCGSNYSIRKKKYKDSDIIYLNCSTYLKRGKDHCPNNTTWPYSVVMHIYKQSHIPYIVSSVMEQVGNESSKQQAIIQPQIDELSQQIQRVLKVIMLSDDDTAQEVYTGLVDKKKGLQAEYDRLEVQSENYQPDTTALLDIWESVSGDASATRKLLQDSQFRLTGDFRNMSATVGDDVEPLTYTLIGKSTSLKAYKLLQGKFRVLVFNEDDFKSTWSDVPYSTIKEYPELEDRDWRELHFKSIRYGSDNYPTI